MALQKTVSLQNNFGDVSTFENAYIKVQNIFGNKQNIVVTYVIKKDSESLPLQENTCCFVPSLENSSDNFIKQAYLHIKTLPEFLDSVDC